MFVDISLANSLPRISPILYEKINRFDLEKLNGPLVMNAFQVNIGDRFAPLTMLTDGDAEMDSIVTDHNKVVTDTAG